MFTKKLKTATIFGVSLRHSEEQRDVAISSRQNLMRLLRRYTPRNDVTYTEKKAAMFGFEGESLKKQSGELFLARLQRLTFRLVEGHQARWLLNSKGAMFGLDARIALAIFGALSVISGAALYSAIKQARIRAIIAEVQEVGKAYEAYYIDTGLQMAELDGINLASVELVSSTAVGWKGPYLQYEIYGDLLYWDKDNSTAVFFTELNDSHSSCSDITDCELFVTIRETKTVNDISRLIDDFDEFIDNGDGLSSGDFRFKENSVSNYLNFKVARKFN